MICTTPGSGLSNFVASNHSVCEKLEKQSLQPFCDRPRILLIRHSFSSPEVLCQLSHVIVANVEYRLLPSPSLNRCEAVGEFCSQLHTGTETLLGPKKERI
jgi:hypothetical protein